MNKGLVRISITVKLLIIFLAASLIPLFLSETMADRILDAVIGTAVEGGMNAGRKAHREADEALRNLAKKNLAQLASARAGEINSAIAETEAVVDVTSEFLVRIALREFSKSWPIFSSSSLPDDVTGIEPAGASMDFSDRHGRMVTYNGASWQAPVLIAPEIISSSVKRYESISYVMHLIFRQLPHALWFNFVSREGVLFTYPGTGPRRGPPDARENLWYREAINEKRTRWSPVSEESGSKILSAICYKPVYGPGNDPIGVLAVQVSISEIFRRLSLKYSNPVSSLALIDPWGVISSQGDEQISDLSWDSMLRMDKDNLSSNDLRPHGRKTPFGTDPGFGTCMLHGKPAYIAYYPVSQLRWSIAVINLEEDVLKPADLVNTRITEGLKNISDDLTHEISSYRAQLLSTRYWIAACAFMFAILLARSFFKPLVKLSSVADRIAAGDFAVRSNIRREDEIGTLADAMDRMAGNLQQNVAELKRSNRTLERRVQEISHLYEFGMAVTDSLKLSEIGESAVTITAKSFGARNAIMFAVTRDKAALKAVSVCGESYQAVLGKEFSLDEDISACLVQLIVRDEKSGSPLLRRIDSMCGTSTPRAIMCPLITPAGLIGTLFVGAPGRTRPFRAGDFRLFRGFSVQLGGAVENAMLYTEVLEKKKIEHELEIASRIQQDILPQSFPSVPGLEIAGFNLPALQVGGDFYDAFEMANGCLGLVIADVSGKGMPAALLMALSRATIRAQAMLSTSPRDILERTNRLLAPDIRSGMFITAFFGVYDPSSSTLRYSCGGHNPPLLFSQDGKQSLLHIQGIALGVLDEIELGEAEQKLSVGDVIVMYTDGVTDTMNAAMKPLGMIPFIRRTGENRGRSAREIIDSINALIDDYSGSNPQFDDITLMVIKRC